MRNLATFGGLGDLKGIDSSELFNKSFFGEIKHGEVYQDIINMIDRRKELKNLLVKRMAEVQLKYSGVSSATGGGAGTAGVGMIPVYVSPLLTDRSRKLTPWVEMTSRVANMGVTHDFNYISAKGAAVFKIEDAALTEADDTRARSSVSMKYAYSVGRVSGQAQAAYPPYMVSGQAGITGPGLGANPFGTASAPNAMQLEVLSKTRSLKELEENKFWNGDATTNTEEYDGIIQLQGDTNDTDKNTTAMDYDDIETAVKDAYDDSGFPNYAGCSSSVLKDLRKIAVDTYRYSPADMATELPFGVTARLTLETIVGAIPVIPSQYLSNTSGSAAIYFLDMTEIYFAVLQDATYEKMAKVNDSEKFYIKLYEALVMRAPQFNSCITEIST